MSDLARSERRRLGARQRAVVAALGMGVIGGGAACAEKAARPPEDADRAPVPRAPKRAVCDFAGLDRIEHRIPSEEKGIELFVLEVRSPAAIARREAVVLLHGAGSPGSAIWDLNIRDYSVLRGLACQGFDAYAVDLRGFGGASMPTAGDVRAERVQPDVRAVVDFARRRSQVPKVHMVAWSWGCVVAGVYASQPPPTLGRLVLFAPVFDRKWLRRHETAPGWRTETRDAYYKYFDAEREERDVLDRYVAGMFRFSKDAQAVRLPRGPYRDIYGPSAPVWRPEKVKVPTLVLRGDRDRASLEAPARRLVARLRSAPAVRYQVLENAGHFAFRTKRHRDFMRAVVAFLKDEGVDDG